MAEPRDRKTAESTLQRLLLGTSVVGVRFGALQLLFDTLAVPGEPYVNLSSAWCVYPNRPVAFPENEEEVPVLSGEEELACAVALRHKEVAAVEVLHPWPHLVLTFSDGSVLYLNGRNERYEPWTAGLSGVPERDRVEVIACPGGGLAFIFPPSG
jgi:hypothetical protein